MEERRQFVRLDTRLPITYRVVTSAPPVQAITKGIGGGGICVFLSEPVRPGTRLHVTVKLPDQERPLTFTGEVVWCEQYEVIGKTQRNRSVEAGLKFVQIEPPDQQRIMQYVILSLQPHSSV